MKALGLASSEARNWRLPSAREVAVGLMGGIVFGLLAYTAITLTRGDGRIAAVWIPNAVALAYLLRARLSNEPLFLAMAWLGNLGANLTAGDALLKAMGLASCNSFEIVLALLLVRRYCNPLPDMQDIGDLSRFVGLAAMIAPMVTALPAAALLAGFSPAFFAAWGKWAVTDGLGMAIVAPALHILADAWERRRKPTRSEVTEWLLLTVVGTTATVLIFAQSQYPLLFFSALIVISHAFRLGPLGTAFSVTKTAVIATVFTTQNLGPISLIDGTMTAKLIVLQCFIATAFLVGLPVSAALSGRARLISELASRRRELTLLTENITDAVLFYDRNGTCTYASPSVIDVLDECPEVFVGSRASSRMHPDAQEKILQTEARLLSGQIEKDRFTYRRYLDDEEGEPVYIEADCALARHSVSQEIEGIVVSARDVTERVELELLLVRARRHAENAARAKSEFLANMSHEIRTPMNGVLGFAELLLQGDLDDQERRHAELIVQSGRSMMLLLNDILDLSKIEAGQIVINREPTDLATMLDECTSLHRAAAEKKGLAIDCAPCEDAPAVLTDGLRLRQIVLNLIGNAVKFTEHGSIRVELEVESERFLLSVSDTGIGIGPDRLERIFNPFEQGENDTARRFGGTGLGLSISRQLAELLGGTLDVESTPGKGTRFTLALPLVESLPIPQEKPVPQQGRGMQLPPQSRILLAEDHDVNRLLVTEMLQRCRQQVTIAHDGNEAIAAVLEAHARGEPFDLVLMDIQMPGCDGYAATRTIRSEGLSPAQLPIIALTANAFPEDVAAARDAGMQAHLAKPLVFAELVGALQRWLPVSIIEEGEIALDGDGFGASANAELFPPGAEEEEPETSQLPALQQVWRQRREEALEAVTRALRAGKLTGADGSELARLVHKLAGTAGMFGEDELGQRAAAFERALRSEVGEDVRMELARDLLAAA